MPAYADRRRDVRPRERLTALAAVVVVQLVLTVIILRGLNVSVTRPADLVQRLVEINVPKPQPPPPQRPPPALPKPEHHQAAAPKAAPDKLGGTVGPKPSHAAPSVAPIIAIKPNAAPSGGGSGTGPAVGSGAGGGTGGNGYGDGDDGGGGDLEQIAGEITPRDYPRELRDAGIGGRVLFTFTVLPNGRVGRCSVTRSSGSLELDALTCRLVQQRFFYRPSTDRDGRPIADEVDGEHDWIARSR